MGYLVQKTRAAQLLIGGQDYTSSLVEFQVTDSGALNNGLIVTSGFLVLGQRPGGSDIQDYDRNIFKRGVLATLDIEEPGGSTYRHPRGYLYVLSVSYNAETEELTVQVGCRLSLAYLTDDASAILPLVPIPLDAAQQTVQNCSASFASAGMVLYQNNQGNLVSRKFFGTDSTAGVDAGEWVSVLGGTALAVSPLAASGAIPDEIELSYQIPTGVLAADNTGKVDTVVETSKYFIQYPAIAWKRRNPTAQELADLAPPSQSTASPPGSSGCGTVQDPPNGGPIVCFGEWVTSGTDEYLPAVRVSTSTTTYGAPGAQASYSEQVVTGPEVEANPQYFADMYALCVSSYASACNPNGQCPYYGMNSATLSKQVTYYQYGSEANELVRTIRDSYRTILSAYNPTEWRSGQNGPLPVDFNSNLSASDGLYRNSRVVTEYSRENNANVQLTTTYTSITSRGVGPTSGASIDALDGIVTTVRRESTTGSTLDVRPDAVNTATTATEEGDTTILLSTNSYTTPPTEAGKYVRQESIPVPLLSEDQSEIDGWIADYSNYILRFVKGDLYGLQIAESMRSEIVTGWYPGMPFRYADTANDRILAMRMDACAWGVTPDEAIVVTNGIWNGFSSGSLNMGSNLVGNSRPDMSGNTPTPPAAPSAPPVIDNDMVGQSFSFIVNVNLNLSSSAFTYFSDGITPPNPADMEGLMEMALFPYVTGFIVETGGLLSTDGTGSIPSEYGGSIVTGTAVVVNADLFATA